MSKYLYFTLLALALSGCGAKYHAPKVYGTQKNFEDRLDLFNTLLCCKSLDQLEVTSFKDELNFTMEENLDLVIINGRITNYLLIELPSKVGTHYYGLRSYYVDSKFVYIPEVSALDSNFKVLGSTDRSYIEFQHPHSIWGDSNFWLYFKFNIDANSKVKYFIIHLSEEIGSKFSHLPGLNYDNEWKPSYDQPLPLSGNPDAFDYPTIVSPSGLLNLRKLNNWDKPINEAIYYIF